MQGRVEVPVLNRGQEALVVLGGPSAIQEYP